MPERQCPDSIAADAEDAVLRSEQRLDLLGDEVEVDPVVAGFPSELHRPEGLDEVDSVADPFNVLLCPDVGDTPNPDLLIVLYK